MIKQMISYDSSNMLRSAVGIYGADKSVFRKNAVRLNKARKELEKEWKTEQQGWLGCPDSTEDIKAIKAAVKKCAGFKTCLVLGIGGSDLGARAAYQALKPKNSAKNLIFAGANTDPDELAGVLDKLDLKTTLVDIISKSGNTIEPMATFLIVRELMMKRLGKENFASQIIATTDRSSGALRELADKEGYLTLSVPENIGGRFSVLTPVGLFPLAFAGIDISKMLAGAKDFREGFFREKPENNPAAQFALLQYLADTERRQNIHVLMPYAQALSGMSSWYRQIWAESLGKKHSVDGETVHVGSTPIAALGATDQHSQIQLYNEGPNNKTVTFIEIGKFAHDYKIPLSAKMIKPLAYVAGKTLQQIIKAERQATAASLADSKRPNSTIHIPEISAGTIGGLFMFFEIATALAGKLYGINPYDQPGVEAGKQAMEKILKREP
ncbi:MAG: glucose-6-phosphate isomerase [Patescibacteria group bacterium]|nr:glucose-6-phosphate isomerase [Patescibacteria group bacterium]